MKHDITGARLANQSIVDASFIRLVLDYSPETGELTWNANQRLSALKGAIAGSINKSTGYRNVKLKGISFKAHRVAWAHYFGEWPAFALDHINGNRLDNRISNLRCADNGINAQNIREARSDNRSSGLLGAYWVQRLGKWVSSISIDGKQIHIGVFSDKYEAHKAYVEAKRKIHKGCTI